MVQDIRIHVSNRRAQPIRLIVEPWANEYPMEPGTSYQVEFSGPSSPNPLEVEDRDDGIVVYGWVGSVYRVRDEDGVEIDRCDLRPPPVP